MIKKLIEKIFGKFCKCKKEEKDEHLQLYEDVPEPEVPVEKEKIQCHTHSRFKKSCPLCVEAAK